MSYDISITKKQMVEVPKMLFTKNKEGLSENFKETLFEEVSEEVFKANYTYNVSPMYYKALGDFGLMQFHNKKAGDCIATLENGIKEMQDNSAEYIKLNPKNGWGNYGGALTVLKNLLDSCKENKDGIITIS